MLAQLYLARAVALDGNCGAWMMDDELSQLFEKMSQRTGLAVDDLVCMALWDFVRTFDWNYEELRQGAIYHAYANNAATSSRNES